MYMYNVVLFIVTWFFKGFTVNMSYVLKVCGCSTFPCTYRYFTNLLYNVSIFVPYVRCEASFHWKGLLLSLQLLPVKNCTMPSN